ncbi:hypothetical protein [Actinoplanes derwentensis]|uniref:Uncharacterized protein n=1 Tax=Actinoplanes derwentensis TaxID=113562 RepID=A0A1H2D8S5_9ACTN|nr:hypothetical protein [Actinoplanes derwentensis]GID81493.1 hypothetical protein Ade03nite_04170 [Actinoplanes derwentensis]SDT79153.1 hypothetical protein SAMN04489716_8668 [Actinoplanes derwentensis]
MIAVAQPVARPGDGQRLLRFLTSLAMLALAVTLRLPGPAPAVEAAPAAAPVAVTAAPVAPAADVAPVAVAPAADVAPVAAAPADFTPAAVVAVTFTTRLRTGVIPGTHGSRAPPAL